MEYRSKIIALARKYNLKEVDANYSENSYNINDKTCSGSLNHNGVTLTFEYDKNNCRAYEKLSFLIYKNGLTKMDLWEKYCNNGFDF